MLDSAYSVSVPVPLGDLPSLRSEITAEVVMIVPFAQRLELYTVSLLRSYFAHYEKKESFGSNPPLKSDLLH